MRTKIPDFPLDDTLIDKNFFRNIELVRRQVSGNTTQSSRAWMYSLVCMPVRRSANSESSITVFTIKLLKYRSAQSTRLKKDCFRITFDSASSHKLL